jgi:hypothetical protein
MRNVEQAADPQIEAASPIVTWVTGGWLKPTGDDFAMVRLQPSSRRACCETSASRRGLFFRDAAGHQNKTVPACAHAAHGRAPISTSEAGNRAAREPASSSTDAKATEDHFRRNARIGRLPGHSPLWRL